MSRKVMAILSMALWSSVTWIAPCWGLDESERVRVVAPGTDGQAIMARNDAKGNLHVLFQSPTGPRYGFSDNGGRSFSKTLSVADPTLFPKNLEFTVWDLAISPQGTVHVALGTNAWKLKLPQEEWGFYYCSLAPDQEAFAPLRNINRKPSEGFSLAADAKGKLTACWLADKLYVQTSQDDGKTFSDPMELDPSFNPCNCCTTSCAYGQDGRLAILYREETNNDRDMFLILWDQNTGVKTRQRVSQTSWKVDSCPMTYYSVVPHDQGYLAIWPTKGMIYFAILDADGKVRDGKEHPTLGANGMRSGMSLVSDRRGNFLAAWKKDNKLAWQLYDSKLRPQGVIQEASSPGAGSAVAVDAQGKFVLFR